MSTIPDTRTDGDGPSAVDLTSLPAQPAPGIERSLAELRDALTEIGCADLAAHAGTVLALLRSMRVADARSQEPAPQVTTAPALPTRPPQRGPGLRPDRVAGASRRRAQNGRGDSGSPDSARATSEAGGTKRSP